MKLEGVVLGADRGKDLSRLRSASPSFKLQSQQFLSRFNRGHSLKIILRCRSQVSGLIAGLSSSMLHESLKECDKILCCTLHKRDLCKDSDQLYMSQGTYNRQL